MNIQIIGIFPIWIKLAGLEIQIRKFIKLHFSFFPNWANFNYHIECPSRYLTSERKLRNKLVGLSIYHRWERPNSLGKLNFPGSEESKGSFGKMTGWILVRIETMGGKWGILGKICQSPYSSEWQEKRCPSSYDNSSSKRRKAGVRAIWKLNNLFIGSIDIGEKMKLLHLWNIPW